MRFRTFRYIPGKIRDIFYLIWLGIWPSNMATARVFEEGHVLANMGVDVILLERDDGDTNVYYRTHGVRKKTRWALRKFHIFDPRNTWWSRDVYFAFTAEDSLEEVHEQLLKMGFRDDSVEMVTKKNALAASLS